MPLSGATDRKIEDLTNDGLLKEQIVMNLQDISQNLLDGKNLAKELIHLLEENKAKDKIIKLKSSLERNESKLRKLEDRFDILSEMHGTEPVLNIPNNHHIKRGFNLSEIVPGGRQTKGAGQKGPWLLDARRGSAATESDTDLSEGFGTDEEFDQDTRTGYKFVYLKNEKKGTDPSGIRRSERTQQFDSGHKIACYVDGCSFRTRSESRMAQHRRLQHLLGAEGNKVGRIVPKLIDPTYRPTGGPKSRSKGKKVEKRGRPRKERSEENGVEDGDSSGESLNDEGPPGPASVKRARGRPSKTPLTSTPMVGSPRRSTRSAAETPITENGEENGEDVENGEDASEASRPSTPRHRSRTSKSPSQKSPRRFALSDEESEGSSFEPGKESREESISEANSEANSEDREEVFEERDSKRGRKRKSATRRGTQTPEGSWMTEGSGTTEGSVAESGITNEGSIAVGSQSPSKSARRGRGRPKKSRKR